MSENPSSPPSVSKCQDSEKNVTTTSRTTNGRRSCCPSLVLARWEPFPSSWPMPHVELLVGFTYHRSDAFGIPVGPALIIIVVGGRFSVFALFSVLCKIFSNLCAFWIIPKGKISIKWYRIVYLVGKSLKSFLNYSFWTIVFWVTARTTFCNFCNFLNFVQLMAPCWPRLDHHYRLTVLLPFPSHAPRWTSLCVHLPLRLRLRDSCCPCVVGFWFLLPSV